MGTPTICRICLTSTLKYVDLESQFNSNTNVTFREGFNFCTNLNASTEDKLPKILCIVCAKEVESAFGLIKRAEKSDLILKEKFNVNNTADDQNSIDLCEEEELISVEIISNQSDIKEEVFEYEYEEISEHLETLDGDDNQLPEIQTDNCEDQLVEETNMFQCDPCQKSFKTRRGCNFHMKTEHRNKKVHLCNICGRICSQRTSLESHMLQHKGERPFTCEHCNKSYFTKAGLQSHMSVHGLENHPAKFLCSTCGSGFATSQRLRVHNLVHTGEKNFSCTMCPKKFATPFRLRNHERIHTGERPFECKECGLKFAQSNALKCHQRIHTGEKPYECKICGKRFNQNTILKTHMTLHTGKTVQCPHCDKKFSRPSYLILHQRDHTGEKPYACHKCPNRYKQKSHLDRHLDTHLGVKHKCNICGKEYSKRSSLKIHMFEHADQKPFQCSDCDMSFSRRDKFKNHLRKGHNKFIINDEVAQIKKEDISNFSHHAQEIVFELKTYTTKRIDGNKESIKEEVVEYLEEDIEVVQTNM